MENQQQEQASLPTQVSETNSTPQVVVAEKADPTKTYMTDNFIQQANGIYHAALQEIRRSKVSRNGVLRALDFASTKGISTRNLGIKLKGKDEGRLAELISLVLENRLILMAAALKEKEKQIQDEVNQSNLEKGEALNGSEEN
jgi:hypothetical protein